MRPAKSTDYFVPMPFGTFRFGRRTYGDRIKIRAEYLRHAKELAGDDLRDDDPELAAHSAIIASYKVLAVDCPPGWESIEDLDLLGNPDAENQVWDLYAAMKEKEDSFREPTGQVGETARQGAEQDLCAVVPQAVPASAT